MKVYTKTIGETVYYCQMVDSNERENKKVECMGLTPSSLKETVDAFIAIQAKKATDKQNALKGYINV